MKTISPKFYLFVAMVGFIELTSSCKPKDKAPPTVTTQYTMQFNLTAGGSPIAMDQTVTYNGNIRYSIDMLRFYLGYPRLVKTDGTEVPMSNLCIVALDKNIPYNSIFGNNFTFTVPAGDYKAVRFGIGIPPAIKDTVKHYHFGAFDPLNENYGMLWQMTSNTFRDIVLQMFTDTTKAQNAIPNREIIVHVLEDNDTLNLYRDLEFDKAFTINSGATQIDNFNIDANQVFFPAGNAIDLKSVGSTDMVKADKTGIQLGIQLDNNFAKAITKQ